MVSRPWAWWLAWIICAPSLAVLAPVVVLAVLNRGASEYWAITEPQGMLGIVVTSLVGVVLAMMLIVVGLAADFVARASGTAAYVVTSPALALATAMVPVAIGIAILRYHLFDIDRVISRAVAYALLTAGVLGAYGVGIVLFQRLLDPVAGSSDLAVAATTLLVAALVRPLRTRIQRAVDRRFNRAHYDAARVIEEFSSRLRNEIDLATIGSELQTVISQTMQPTHVSLWLRSPSSG